MGFGLRQDTREDASVELGGKFFFLEFVVVSHFGQSVVWSICRVVGPSVGAHPFG